MTADPVLPRERNEFLRSCEPGEELELECTDSRTRTIRVTAWIGKANGSVTLKAEGHGTTYQIDVPSPSFEGAVTRIRWPSGCAWVRKLVGEMDPDQIWSDTTAADLGIPNQ